MVSSDDSEIAEKQNSTLPAQFRNRPLLKKPFQIDSLKRMLDAALAPKA